MSPMAPPIAPAGARLLRATTLITTVLALGACAKVPTQSASMQASPNLLVSASQLQLQCFEAGRTLSTIIEQGADSIRAVSADPVIRRNALLWKISAIPLVQEAALRDDPLVAGIDLITFTLQQSDYFTSEAGREAFGPQQPIAVEAARQAMDEMMALAARVLRTGRLADTSAGKLRAWAANHPIKGPAFRRLSVLGADWEALGLSDRSLGATIGNVDRRLANLSFRLSYLNETLAAQARWNAELATADALSAPRMDSLLGTGTATMRSVGALVDDAPALMTSQRQALMRDIDDERMAIMRDIDRQRMLAFQEIAAQRQALEASLAAERVALMEQVGQERAAAFRAADSLAQRSIDRSGSVMRRLGWQLTLAALIVVAALLGSGLILINRWRGTAA
jgi:hypothetical protein